MLKNKLIITFILVSVIITMNCKREIHLYDGDELIEIHEITGYHKYISYTGLNITRIQGLDKITELEELDLSWNKLTTLKGLGLEKLTNLKILKIHDNKISKIEGLDNLINLKELLLYNNRIRKIEGLENLVNLEKL